MKRVSHILTLVALACVMIATIVFSASTTTSLFA